jgi:hypothetical protein
LLEGDFMGTPINWAVREGDIALLQSPLYQKYASTSYGALTSADIKDDIKACLASNESAAIVAYLSSLLRVLALVA